MAINYAACFALTWYCFVWAIGLLGFHVARKRYGQPTHLDTPLDARTTAPGVTIIRPLCGLDDNLYENLESSFLQRYAQFELLFCVDSERDQAIPVVRSLMSRYSHVNARLYIGASQAGANPKINNLSKAYREAAHDLVWILDSNVLTSTSTLSRSVAALIDPRIGLVHHLPYALYPGLDWGARLDQAFLNTAHAKMYLAINEIAVDTCLTGKSTLFRKSDLARGVAAYKPLIKAGLAEKPGIDGFASYLGEDNMIGAAIWHGAGLRHAMTPDLAGNTVGGKTFGAYFWRRVRWIRVRRNMVLAATLAEPFQESLVMGCIGAFALHRLFSVPAWLVFALNLVAWYNLDTLIFASLAQASPSHAPARSAHEKPGGLGFLGPWLLRETLALPIWLVAMVGGSTIGWRGDSHRYRLKRDGTVEAVDHLGPITL